MIDYIALANSILRERPDAKGLSRMEYGIHVHGLAEELRTAVQVTAENFELPERGEQREAAE